MPLPGLKNTFYFISPISKLSPLPDIKTALNKTRSKKGYVWFCFFKPEPGIFDAIKEQLGLHPLAIEDCFDDNQIPKLDLYSSNSFMLLNKFQYQDNTLYMDEIDLFVGKKIMIMLAQEIHSNEALLKYLGKLLTTEQKTICEGPDFLLKAIIDYIVDDKFLAIDSIRERLDTIENSIVNQEDKFDISALIDIKQDILKLRKSIIYEREMIFKICRGDSPYISQELKFYFRDIYDHIIKLYEELEVHREMASSLMEIYISRMNYNMSLDSNTMNKTMRRLTLITTIFMPLTFLTGMFGMSEWSMITGVENWKFTYLLFFIISGVIALITNIFLKLYEKKDSRGGQTKKK
ncbi:MAG: magnesium transporter CorA family protein [Spirochaetales bacterium]|nr:magnesium transporter CorA family protein [Spirochaetales bacterium]